MTRSAVALTLCLCAVENAAAQRVRDVPARPALAANADTNSAAAYYQHGVRRLHGDPREAAAAFYWAMRLNPEAAEYPYARWIALVINDIELFGVPRIGPSERSAEARSLDSLMMRSLMLDPFLHRRLDEELLIELGVLILGGNRATIPTEPRALERYINQVMGRSPQLSAQLNYSRGHFDDALAMWARWAREAPRNPYLRVARARAFYLKGSFDSARVEMQEALAIARRRDVDSTRFFYENKTAWEFSLGRVFEQLGNLPAAREAYERALTEDLSYYTAHIRLGALHMDRGDTAAALREFGRAVGAKDDEYLPRTTYAFLLANTGRLDSALIHIRRAIELEPYAAQPRVMLGAVLDARNDTPGALAAYEQYLARASRNDPDLASIQIRVDQLRAARR